MSTHLSKDEIVTVSAPGKILVAGGYLILESPNIGVVVAVDKRFYTTVAWTRAATDSSPTPPTVLPITVRSPQFGQTYYYTYDYENRSLEAVDQVPESQVEMSEVSRARNTFVEKTLRVCFWYWHPESSNSSTFAVMSAMEITIQADNDFYSLLPHLQERQLGRTWEDAQLLPRFLPVFQSSSSAASTSSTRKTGLGSSAALVTSLVGALSLVMGSSSKTGGIDFSMTQSTSTGAETLLSVVYKLAQVCHCHAQGKVGSGFDVSAACYGSHVYKRFPPTDSVQEVLRKLDHEEECSADPSIIQLLLRKLISSPWEGGVQQPIHCIHQPTSAVASNATTRSFIQVMLADISGGSESPSMARAVLEWKAGQRRMTTNESAAESSHPRIPFWDDLKPINRRISEVFQQMDHITLTDSEQQALLRCEHASAWKDTASPVGMYLYQLRESFQEARYYLRELGKASGVPIEPPEQTELADATLQIPGVIAAIVPGAGGYDALACLYLNSDIVRQKIGQLWESWSAVQVCPLTVQGASFGQGVQVEEQAVWQ